MNLQAINNNHPVPEVVILRTIAASHIGHHEGADFSKKMDYLKVAGYGVPQTGAEVCTIAFGSI